MTLRPFPPERRTLLAVALLGVLLLFVSGCANLQAVQDFAKTSAATADYKQIVADYATSPDRQKRYQPARSAPQLEAKAKARAEQKLKLEAAQTILVEYMAALGDLAANDLPKVDTGIDALGKALEKAKFVGEGDAAISKETATAAGTIAKLLNRVVLDHWRQKQTSRIVKEADDSIQIVTAGLREIVLKDFNASFDTEEESVRKYFEASIAAARAGDDTEAVLPLARILWLEHSDRIEARRAKLKAYAGVLDRIGKGHADLARNVDRLQDKDLKERLRGYGKDLKALYKAIETIGK